MFVCLLTVLLPSKGQAYLCDGRPFQSVTVSASKPYAGGFSSYTINTRLPLQAGCGISADTEIAILLAEGIQAESGTVTVNGIAVTRWIARAGERLIFRSPVQAGPGSDLLIQLDWVQNPAMSGTKTIVLSALTGEANQIGPTVSQPFSLYPGWWPPWLPSPTPNPTPPCGADLCDQNCLPGGGLIRSDCLLQWLVPAHAERLGRPRRVQKVICYEGDPGCDLDPNVADGACTIPVSLCANTTDARLLHCQPTDLRQVEFRVSRSQALRDAADQHNLQALQLLAGPGGLQVRVTSFGSTVFSGRPLTDLNTCTNAAMLRVGLKRTASGRWRRVAKTFRTTALSSWGQVDYDKVKLECRPSTCGNGIVELDHESCDDGNRADGDGCNRGCQNRG